MLAPCLASNVRLDNSLVAAGWDCTTRDVLPLLGPWLPSWLWRELMSGSAGEWVNRIPHCPLASDAAWQLS